MIQLKPKLNYPLFISAAVLLCISSTATDEKDNGRKKKKEPQNIAAPFSLNNKSVKIYPDAFKREMHVVSKEKTETQFFVFDAEGTLVINQSLKESEHIKLTGLKRGFYTYHLFEADEEKATGRFEIR